MLKSSKKAVRVGMKVVRRYQLLDDDIFLKTEVKSDDTFVTYVDRTSGEAIRDILQNELPNVSMNIEDIGQSSGNDDIIMLVDPLDGTSGFVAGLATSTVIVATYCKQVISCVIGEPITGRLWFATSEIPTQLEMNYQAKRVTVWSGEISTSNSVFMDVAHGFTRGQRQILNSQQMSNLLGSLSQRVKILVPGSNGLIQALVANGGERVLGSITTAIGGPWDVCGVLLVLQAGGSARAFTIADSSHLIEKNPLDVINYDILITGNSQETVDKLYNIVAQSL